jgi:anti-anti-sigma factor
MGHEKIGRSDGGLAGLTLSRRRACNSKTKKRINGPAPRPVLPTICQAIVELIARLPPQRCPRWQKWICSEKQVGSLLSAARYTQEAPMKIETRKNQDVLVVDMSGTLDSTSSGEAGDRIVNIAKGEHKRVLLNLAELEYVSSAGLRVILRGAKLLQGKRGELKICNAKGPVKDVLKTSGFNNLIRVYDTEQEAFSAFL